MIIPEDYTRRQIMRKCNNSCSLRGFTPLEKATDFNPVRNKLSNGVREQSSLTGFTLIELVIVVIIIGILAAIALPRYGKTVENSRVAEATSILGTIRAAQMRYVAEYDDYTNVLSDLDLNIAAAGRYFNFDVDAASSAEPFTTDDEVIATATRNGWSVGGGYNSNYWVKIDERGNFTSGGGGAPGVSFPIVGGQISQD